MRIGSLFSGYGGLDLAASAHFGADIAWYSEIEPAACTVLETHHRGIQNIGDITQVRWEEVPPVDILTGGYPCQPFSTAGARKGTNDERHLWPYVRDAISVLRPRVVVLENVRGHLTLGLNVVLADLAGLGISARWGVVRASDAGAPHRRERIFIVAANATSAERRGSESTNLSETSQSTPEPRERTRVASDPASIQRRTRSNRGETEREQGNSEFGWGDYEAAIKRWEEVLGRRAPDPTVLGRNDRPRLAPRFVEWMMGLPDGWVTGHGLSASQELKMLGNGVVPRQAALALDLLRVE